MKLDRPCDGCGITESYGFSSSGEVMLCADCKRPNVNYNVYKHGYTYKKQHEKHAKDLIQPFTYDKHEKEAVLNPDFKRVYPDKAKNIQQGMKEAPKTIKGGKLTPLQGQQ